MRKNIMSKIFAFLALFWIIIWIVWTGILFFMSPNTTNNSNINLTSEELQKLIQSWTWVQLDNSIEEIIDSWTVEETQTWSMQN